MTNYSNGVRGGEYKVRDALTADGYSVIRSAGSKGAVDLVAFKKGDASGSELLFVQVKRGKPAPIPPDERQKLLRYADQGEASPIVAYCEPRKPITYRRLTGPGAKESVPWTPDWQVA